MTSQNIVFEDSDSSIDTDCCNSENIPPTKRRGIGIDWLKECTYPNAELAVAAIKSENLWWKKVENDTNNGKKIIYICKVASSCQSKVMLHFEDNSQQVIRYKVNLPHDHSDKNRKNGIPPEIKQVIADLFKSGVTKPKLILKNIADKQLTQPNLKQLNNYLVGLRREIHGPPVVSLGQLKRICEEKSTPTGPDDPFILNYDINSDDQLESRFFRFFITTKRLLSMLYEHEHTLHADGTYKIVWQGFPVLVVGTSDMDRKFHIIGLAVATSETEEDFRFLFESLKQNSLDKKYKPKVLVADCADAIANACREAYGNDVVRVHCWAHVIRNIDKKILLVPENLRQAVRTDIFALQLCKPDDEFTIAKGLWIKKWRTSDLMEPFCKYFIEEYLITYNGWYEGRALSSPSTNNCLESTNNVLKNEGTLRQRLPLGEFINTAMSIIKQWSFERDPINVNCKFVSVQPTMTMKLMTESYTWFKLIKANPTKVKFRQFGSSVLYFIVPGEIMAIKESDIKMFLNYKNRKSWRSFDTYRKYQSSLWLVSIEGNAWRNGSCTCPVFLKTYICKHLIGIAISKKLLEVPDEAKAIPVGEKRKRGRPAKAKKALLFQ